MPIIADSRALLSPIRILRKLPHKPSFAELTKLMEQVPIFKLIATADIHRLLLTQLEKGILQQEVTSNKDRIGDNGFLIVQEVWKIGEMKDLSFDDIRTPFGLLYTRLTKKMIDEAVQEETHRVKIAFNELLNKYAPTNRDTFMPMNIALEIVNKCPLNVQELEHVSKTDAYSKYFVDISNAIM